jgi:hypothetical protein
MHGKLYLRAAAVITLLLAIGHTLGHPWLPVLEDQGRAVVAAMGAYRFDVMGLSRSYRDFHLGFGWMLAAYLYGHAVLFWQLAGLPLESRAGTRAIVAVLLLEALVITTLAGMYLFWIPLLMSASIALCLSMALFVRRPPNPD